MTSGKNSRLAVTREALVKLPGEPVWIVLVVLVLVMAVISDVFLTPDNLLNVLRQVSIIGVIAVGVTIALIGGNFDLSVGFYICR